jgi:cyclopropane-fatty-acyl-phospholipid synthase
LTASGEGESVESGPVATARPGLDDGSRTVDLLDRLFPRPRNFAVRLWNGQEVPAASSALFCLVLKHPGALRRMLTPPIELSLGEAFIYGDFDVEGDIFCFFPVVHSLYNRMFLPSEIISLARQIFALPQTGRRRDPRVRGPARLRGSRHSLKRDRAAIQYHYDLNRDFYALWLGRRMQYSCAYFQTGTEDLDTAQEQKLAYICRKLRLRPGDRLLDIGCGFGGLAMFAAEKYGVEVLGITLSRSQAEYANERMARAGLADRVTIKLQDYRELGTASFDKIVSVGMVEHVGCSHLPEYFTHVHRLLKPGQVFLNHGIANFPTPLTPTGAPDPSGARRYPLLATLQKVVANWALAPSSFWQHYVFPDGELTPVSQGNAVAEAVGFEVRDVECLREHYALTIRKWVAALDASREQAVQVTDEVTWRTWRLHLAASAYGFEIGEISINQTLLVKPVAGRSGLPLTRAYMSANDATS